MPENKNQTPQPRTQTAQASPTSDRSTVSLEQSIRRDQADEISAAIARRVRQRRYTL